MKKALIEELRSLGAVAAHNLDRWVTVGRGTPKQVTLKNPLFMDKKKLRTGDKIAIIDSDENTAYLCRATRIETTGISDTPVINLAVVKTIEF
jgi:hypothetical protein